MLRSGLMLSAIAAFNLLSAQTRFIDEVFTQSEINVTSNVTYGVNIDFLTSNFASAQTPADITTLQTLVATSQPIPPSFFNPLDSSTVVKVRDVRMDIYEPDQAVDQLQTRPVVVILHTGNLLPPGLNGSPLGTKTDSVNVELANRWARRGYVAITVENRHGWNPLAATLNERRGGLLNAVYRAIHDVKQAVRTIREDASSANTYAVDGNNIVLMGEGTGGYIALGYSTLDDPAEMFIEKFRPDPFDPAVSFIDTTMVGNIDGFGGTLNLYQDNGFSSDISMCVNLGGALADTSWLEPGNVPMVAFHAAFDPFAPFDDGIVIVPTTGEQVVPLAGSNIHVQLANDFGNNDSFASLPDDAVSAVARSLYGTTQSHGSASVQISPSPEGLFPILRPVLPPPFMEEASPWQWWDPNSAVANIVLDSASMLTTGLASMASNPDMSPQKARTYIDTIMWYTAPRVVCALNLGPCSLVGIDETDPIAIGVDVFPNPTADIMNVTSEAAIIRSYQVMDIQGRIIANGNVGTSRFTIDSENFASGQYVLSLQFDEGKVGRLFVVE